MSKHSEPKVILITGASAGMGKATAVKLINEGHIVYGAARRVDRMRDLEKLGGHAIEMDVTDEAQVTSAVDQLIAEQGRIDVLVNNAGYSVYGAVEDVTTDDARRQFEVNLFGAAFLTQKVLPHMRKRNSGHIINITSVGGKVYVPLGAWYHATKHALEGWSDCLRVETNQFGIKVSVVEPGAIQTEFSDVMNKPMLDRSRGGPYEAMAHAIVKTGADAYDGTPATKPELIAETIAKAINSRNPKTRYRAGKLAKPLLFFRWLLSDRVFDRIILGMVKQAAKRAEDSATAEAQR
ncbi:MAG: oxidoreductase [Candidatus Thiodiazotropha taylori]|nr:oxidoreductase [Candidatus Thiodiazotropha taylori]MCG8079865.1 oxidoreductase [Candidatus Thiodiazotropha taylori]MCG8109004.1 oxidoreductase [Candidatus Thiodiazotropha taylori]MCG8111943.1 oxidoreductase [Candidatus Thiodiazotropha taylori]MCG8122837.1 oxidoreductase [Candidatus Thiodiazotropha taylori]